ILFIADIIGRPGLEISTKLIPGLRDKYNIDLCIANGENGCEGKGLTSKIARTYFNIGIDIITSGNHIWDNYDIYDSLNNDHRILRPLNYPHGNHGKGSVVIDLANGLKVGVMNLQGRTFMFNIDCPFRRGLDEVRRIKKFTNIIIVDFHAEATAEKMAMGWWLDGKVSAVIGTHTHVPTADERILPEGTAYITDVGMTGPFDSVIGLKKELAIRRFLHQTPVRYKPAENNIHLCGAVITIDSSSGKAKHIERLFLP
ncbi:MAG: TIGR00282 family metallophosphoesterase, partial [Calditrichaeota bacterium]